MYVCIQLVAVLADRELLVVVDRDVDLLPAHRFVLWVVELRYVWVAEGLLRGEAFVGVELQEGLEQVERVIGGRGEHIPESLGLGGWERLEHGLRQGAVDGVDVVLSGSPNDLHDPVQLVECGCAWEDGLTQEQFSQDAAQTPHVDALGVLVAPEEDLGCAVPSGCHIVCEYGCLIGLFSVERTRKAVIRHLHVAFTVQQEVAGFEVAVEKICGVHVLEALEHLVNDVLFVYVFEDVRANHRVQVGVHEVKDEVDVTVVLGADNVLQADDVFMAGELLQKDDLAEGALRVGCVLEGVEIFLKGNDLLGLLINGLPHNTVGTLTYNN